jgi:hypothetical protein
VVVKLKEFAGFLLFRMEKDGGIWASSVALLVN